MCHLCARKQYISNMYICQTSQIFIYVLIINMYIYIAQYEEMPCKQTFQVHFQKWGNMTFVTMQITKNPAVRHNLAQTPVVKTGIRIWLNQCKQPPLTNSISHMPLVRDKADCSITFCAAFITQHFVQWPYALLWCSDLTDDSATNKLHMNTNYGLWTHVRSENGPLYVYCCSAKHYMWAMV